MTLLARLVIAAELGAYRHMIALHLVLGSFVSLGFDALLIRNVSERDKMRGLNQAALTLTVSAVSLIVIAGHSLWVRLMNFEEWSIMLWMFPPIVIIQAWKTLYKNRMVADLAYREIMIGETMFTAVSMMLAVAVVMVYPFAWLLYLAYGLGDLTELLYLRKVAGFKPYHPVEAFKLFFREEKQYRKEAGMLCADGLLGTLGNQTPVIMLGSMVSKAAAAGFSLANWFISVPILLMIGALTRVVFPALAGLSKEELRTRVKFIVRASAVSIAPVLIGISVLAEPMVHIALGEKWIESTVPLVRWISVYYIFVVLFSPIGSLDILLNRVDLGVKWNVAMTALRIVAIWIGLRYSVETAVALFAGVSVVMWLIWGMILSRLAGCTQREFHGQWLAAVPAWAVLFVMLLIPAAYKSQPFLALFAAAGPAVVYAGIVVKFYPDVFALLRRFARISR